MNTAHTFCNHCGNKYDTLEWPRKCTAEGCGKMTWANPIPVAVAVTEVYLDPTGKGDANEGEYLGLLGVNRKVAPTGLALPGGFVDNEEDWTTTLSREIGEEVSIDLAGTDAVLNHGQTEAVLSTPDGTRILIFARTEPLVIADLAELEPMGKSNETDGVILITGENTAEIVFSLHQQVAEGALGLQYDLH